MNKIFAIIFSLQLMLAPMPAHAGPGAAAYVKALSSIAMGSAGSVAIASCNFAWSTSVFMIGSLGMIAGDIALAKSYTDYQKKKKAEIKFKLEEFKTANGDIQKEVIDQRLAMEYEELKNIKRRETLHYAIGTVLLAATVLAIIENIQAWGPVPNPLWISNGGCRATTLKVLGVPVSQLVQMAWGMAASAGGGTSGAGQLFTYLQMGLSLATGVVSSAMGKMFDSGVGRAAFFGANSALVYWVAIDLSSRKKTVEDNIAQLKKVVADVKKTETEGGVETGPTDYTSPDNTPPEGNIKALAQGETPKECLSINPAAHNAGTCASPVKLTVPKFPTGINPLISSLTSNMVSATNDLSNGDFDSADVKLEGIASQAKRVKDLLATVQKDYNDKMKAEKKPTVDFDAAINKQVASMQNDIGATIGASPASIAAANSGNAQVSETPAPEAPAGITTAVAPAAPEMDMGLGGVTTEEVPMETSAPTASLDESLGQYESTVEDISKKSDVSIFKQVSNRYLLNYTKIFKEKKRIEEAAP